MNCFIVATIIEKKENSQMILDIHFLNYLHLHLLIVYNYFKKFKFMIQQTLKHWLDSYYQKFPYYLQNNSNLKSIYFFVLHLL